MVNIQIVKSFSKPKDQVFNWWVIIAQPGEILPKDSMRSQQQYIDKLYVYNFFKKRSIYKIQWDSCQKPNSLTKFIKYISLDQIYFYCIFMRSKVWQKYCLLMQKKNGFVEFHHFMKKERLNNSSKTFFNQWEPMGFRKLQTKKKCEEISTTRLRHVNKH